jgi:hypothetical protein
VNILYEKYSRIAPVAELYEFGANDIEEYLQIIAKSEYRNLIYVDPELCLRALLVRLDVNKWQFEDKITQLFFKSLDELRKAVGLQQIPLVYALYFR